MPGKNREYLTVTKEQLGGGVHSTSLLFHPGGNVYVLTYRENGLEKHTLVDSGDERYYDEMLSILGENDINVNNIERIVITHRHSDHIGLAYLLAKDSGAKIIAHHSFRSYVETGQADGGWLNDSDHSHLKDCDIEYLVESEASDKIQLAGVNFPNMSGEIDIGESGCLNILGSPKTRTTHSPDQLIVLYSPRHDPHPHMESIGGFRPTDDIIFSGDLWLMRGPMFNYSGLDLMWSLRVGLRQMGSLMSGSGFIRRDPRAQDAEAKDALKKGFCLIRVKPGHGDEFLGSRILPRSLMADNDILVEFGYPLNTGKEILRSPELASKVADRREQAYVYFTEELALWIKLDYDIEEISKLLVRIYREQSGGGPLVEEDRRERREQLKILLSRLSQDDIQPVELREAARTTQDTLKASRI
jgi:glyoxylase-like metal-dependent hydrolase (beta-lactamase superfamily II)